MESEEFKQRKRHQHDTGSNHVDEDEEAMRARFQRAFEAKFKPLDRSQVALKDSQQDESGEDLEAETDSDWSGLSEDEEPVQTIRYDASIQNGHEIEQHERKAFMVRVERLRLQTDCI